MNLPMQRVILLSFQMNIHLLEEVVEGLYQVVDEIELIMIHLRRHDNC